MTQHRYLETRVGLTASIGGRAYSFDRGHKRFVEILSALRGGESVAGVLEIVNRDAAAVERIVRRQLSENIVFDDGVIYYQGSELHNDAVTRLLGLLERGHDATAVVNFIEKLKRNPDQTVVEVLYSFLEFGKIPLTVDGDFLVYKAVREDYKDIHSGTYLNSVGANPMIPRGSVDPDRNRTCSHGLHVCSYAYLPHFANANGHVMMCKVSPEDVVAIPADYNNTKMRVCSYEVVEEVTKYYQEGKDVLGEGPALREEKYEVWYGQRGTADVYDVFFTEDEARRQADAIKAYNGEENQVLQPGDEVWVEHGDDVDRIYTA